MFAVLQRSGGNQAVEPQLLFRCQSGPIGCGWGAVVTHPVLDGYYSAYGAPGRKKIESILSLRMVLDEYHDIVVLCGRDLKAPDCFSDLCELLDGNPLLIGRNPQKVGNVGWQESVVSFLEGLIHRQSKAVLSARWGRLLRVRQRERYDPQD